MRKVIGVFDSGIGGLSTLAEVKRLLPDYEYIYVSDSENATYGDLSQAELLAATVKICQKLYDAGARLIIIACNTATTQCIADLRGRFRDVLFVGTEPAVKLACDKGYRNILVLATPNTIKSDRLNTIVKQNANDRALTLLSCPNLAHLIETQARIEELKVYAFQSGFDDLLAELLSGLFAQLDHDKEFDGIVLGCTHYVHIAEWIQSYFPKAALLNGNSGVARRVKQLLAASR